MISSATSALSLQMSNVLVSDLMCSEVPSNVLDSDLMVSFAASNSAFAASANPFR